jgi:hypothetical protein
MPVWVDILGWAGFGFWWCGGTCKQHHYFGDENLLKSGAMNGSLVLDEIPIIHNLQLFP